MSTTINSTIFKGLPEVTNTLSFNQKGPTPDGLYSETIFGVSLKDSTNNFAYINLGTYIMNPALYTNIGKLHPLFKKLIDPQYSNKAILSEGMLIESPNGKRGLGWLYSIWNQIDFDKYIKGNRVIDNYNFGSLDLNEVFLDKWLVGPPIYRPAIKQNGLWVEDEITGLYKEIMRAANVKKGQNQYMDKLLDSTNKVDLIQSKVNKLYQYIIDMITSSAGLQEQKLVGKRMNNVARLVANASPRIPMDCVGLPWFVLLGLMDMLLIGVIYQKPKEEREEFLKSVELPSSTLPEEFGKHFDYIYRNVDVYTSTEKGKKKRDIWINIIKETIELNPEIKFLTKRDPSWTSESQHSLKPVIICDNAYHVVVNSFLYVPLGGDSFSTKICGIYKKGQTILKKEIEILESDLSETPEIKSKKIITEVAYIRAKNVNKTLTMKATSIFNKKYKDCL